LVRPWRWKWYVPPKRKSFSERRYNPENLTLHLHRRENLKSKHHITFSHRHKNVSSKFTAKFISI
jgi:hypothetical protein